MPFGVIDEEPSSGEGGKKKLYRGGKWKDFDALEEEEKGEKVKKSKTDKGDKKEKKKDNAFSYGASFAGSEKKVKEKKNTGFSYG